MNINILDSPSLANMQSKVAANFLYQDFNMFLGKISWLNYKIVSPIKEFVNKNFKNASILLKDIAKKGFFHLLSSKILLRVTGAISTLLVIKWLTTEELGQINTMRTYVHIAIIIAGFGFNTSILKLCSENRPIEEKAFILKKTLIYSFISIFIVLAVLYILANLSILSPDERINDLLPYFMFSIPSIVILNMLDSYMQAIKQIKRMATLQIMARVLNISAIIILTYFYGITGYIIGLVVISYFTIPLVYRYIKDFIRTTVRVKQIFKISFYYAKWSAAANSITTVGTYMDILLLNFLILDRNEFGLYSAAVLILFPIREITKTVRDIAFPYFTEKQNNEIEFYRVLKKYKSLMLLLAIAVAITASIVIPVFVNYFFGDTYDNTSLYFLILVVGFIFHSNAAIIATSVISVGRMKYNFLSSSIYVPISLGLNYFFILEFGVIGAAIAQSLTSFIAMIVITIISTKGLREHFNNIKKQPL